MFARFRDALHAVFQNWYTLQVAVVEEWGGPKSRSKYEEMTDCLVENCEDVWRSGKNVPEDTVADYLEDMLSSYFNIDYQDGGREVDAVAKRIADIFRGCGEGDFTLADAAMEEKPREVRASGAANAYGDDEDEDGEEDGEDDGEGGGGGAGGGGDGGDAGSDGGEASNGDADAEGEGGAAKAEEAAEEDPDGWVTVPSKSKGRKGK